MAFAVSISVSDTVSAAATAVGSCPRPTDAATLPERRAGACFAVTSMAMEFVTA
jgi:hypothetical protein